MKAAKDTFRTGDLNEFDQGFQADMDALCEKAYAAFEKSAHLNGT